MLILYVIDLKEVWVFVCFCLSFVILGDPRRPYPTDLEMRSGLLGQMNNPSTNGVNGHLPGDALAAGRLPGNVN